MQSVSVIITTCNRYDSLLSTVQSVLQNTRQPDEIIIVDQSDDRQRMKAIIDSCKSDLIQLLFLDKKGASLGRNTGMQACSGDIIAFTDDDAHVGADWIEKTLETFADRRFKTGVATGEIVPVYESRNPDWSIPERWEHILPAYRQKGGIGRFEDGYPPGVNYCIRREVMENVGLFDEDLGPKWGRRHQLFGEDTDYSMRILDAGYDIVYNPGSVVYHPVPLSRQTREFLLQRLYSKGLTDIAIEYRRSMPSKPRMLLEIVYRMLKYVKLRITRKEVYAIRRGKRSILTGQMAMIKAHLLYENPVKSNRF